MSADDLTMYGFHGSKRSPERMTHILRPNEQAGGKSLCGIICFDVSTETEGPMCGRCIRKSAAPPPPTPRDLDVIRTDLVGLRALVTHLNVQVAAARSRADMAVADLSKVRRELARVLKDQAARDEAIRARFTEIEKPAVRARPAPSDARTPEPDVVRAAPPGGGRYLTRLEAAELALLHPGSLDRLCAQGLGPKRIKIGRPGGKGRVLFDRDEVIRWLSAQQEAD